MPSLAFDDFFSGRLDASAGCWLWLGCQTDEGYGRVWFKGRVQQAHRVALTLASGPFDAALEVDHLCFQPACCRPEHLEAVTGAENLRRKYARITSCSAGHPYDADNTYIKPDGRRDCRACIRGRVAAYKARKTVVAA